MGLVEGTRQRLLLGLVTLVPFVGSGLRWWWRELGGLVPAAVRSWVGVGVGELRLRLLIDAIEVETDESQFTQDTKLPLDGGGALPSVLAAAIHQGRRGVLVLSRTDILIRRTELPLAAAAYLHEATSFLVEKLTPFTLDQAFHAARPLIKDRKRKKLRAEIVVAARKPIENALARLADEGMVVSAIRIDGDVGRPAFDLLRGSERKVRATRGRREVWQFVSWAAVLLFVLGPLGVALKTYLEAEDLAAQVQAEAGSGKRAAALRVELEKQVADRNFLPSRQQGPRAIEVLRSLTQTLPDDVWLFRMEYRLEEVVFAGFATDVPDVLKRLDAASFPSPELTTAVVHGLREGRSRFEVKVRFQDRPRTP